MRTLFLLTLAACNSAPPPEPAPKPALVLQADAPVWRIDAVHGTCTPLPDGTERCCSPGPTGITCTTALRHADPQ